MKMIYLISAFSLSILQAFVPAPVFAYGEQLNATDAQAAQEQLPGRRLYLSEIYEIKTETEIALIASSAALYGANFIVRDSFPAKSADDYGLEKLDKNGINLLDRWALFSYSSAVSGISDFTLAIAMAAPLPFVFADSIDDPYLYLLMYAETLFLAQSFKELVKGVFPRYRPYNYTDEPDPSLTREKDSAESFFSGHTAIAFASASFLSNIYSRVHPDGAGRHWVRAFSYGTAAATGALRIAAGKHFPTDVAAAALWGTFAGFLVPALHERKNEAKKGADLLLLPAGVWGVAGRLSF